MQDYFQDAHPSSPSASAIHASSPEQLVDKALYALEKAGVQLIEWKSLLYRRMGVPVILKNFQYLVPDEQLECASTILEEGEGLPLSIPPPLLLKTGGDFYAKAMMHRVSQYTSVAQAQHLMLYPASLAAYAHTELELKPRLTPLAHPNCENILVPSPPAVYASLLRMMRSYPRYSPTRKTLESDLSELIGYNLYGLEDGFVDCDDEELCENLQVDRRVGDAIAVVRAWRQTSELRDEDNWIAETLEDIVSGRRDIEDVPWAAPPARL
ncbi:uncharacterized protein TRAVEDRAFT_125965 [Trametes versicolor FP-101664 SS1]|uniref:uncharacterized protein n=1 Tax=Trametes versicolor (strain FP-101664) TaxID=717944 RepID=UPI0004622332|nr:uncharacterized protein TRAVEDRAFT_125965 [Trametes versicolor FP-101664 SS1]EIW57701.1 hypothetical protein TRAVEDRAFT_125965 [Trametes versicolor FP-101664 SS1]